MKEDMQKEKSEYLLKWALEEQLKQDEEMNRYPSEDDIHEPHIFSAEHEERMKTVLKMAEKEETRRQRKRRKLQMAAGIAAMLCISSVTVMQSEAFRVPMIRFFSEVNEKYTFFGVEKERGYLTKSFQEYEPQYVPDGFSVLRVKEEFDRFSVDYIKEEDGQRYSIYFYDKIVELGIDTEDAATKTVVINGKQAYMVEKGQDIRAVINIDGKSIYLSGNILPEEAIKILESF